MSRSKRVQAAQKKAQNARIKAKLKTKSYVDKVGDDGVVTELGYLNNQQPQKTMAAKDAAIKKARVDYDLAIEDLAVAEIDGEGLEAAKENAYVAKAVWQNLEAANVKRPKVSLTNVGGV